MRALTIRQPYAWAIFRGAHAQTRHLAGWGNKTVENRSRNIAGAYRGRVAIHAGLADAEGAPDVLWMAAQSDSETTVLREPGISQARWQPRGVILGTVHLWAVHQANPFCCPNRGVPPYGDPWALPDSWHLCLAHPVRFADPIPATGKQGLWTPDATLAATIRLHEELNR